MNPDQILCIVTIHGVGFQQPPRLINGKKIPGYADQLHANLCQVLNQGDQVMLSDDPDRQDDRQQGESVPIYVESLWPPDSNQPSREEGLRRLGGWDIRQAKVIVDPTDKTQQLVKDGARIAHVALVYSDLEEGEPAFLTGPTAAAMAAIYSFRYANIGGLMKTLFRDVEPLLKTMAEDAEKWLEHPSLSLRQSHQAVPLGQPGGLGVVIHNLQNDIAAYVCQNGRRQRVRTFITEALQRLASRADVAAIVLNTHSNGTIIGLDALQELPPSARERISTFITAGSPIRKYVDFFMWGKHLRVVPGIDQWVNCWRNYYDQRDFVADPLLPCAGWDIDTVPTAAQETGVYQAFDSTTGTISNIPIQDVLVDNVHHNPEGLQDAHDYWDNTQDFIKSVAEDILEPLAKGARPKFCVPL